MGSPLVVQDGRRIFMAEIGREGFLKGSAEQHCGSGVFLPPAVEVAIAVTARAAEVLADLSVAVVHHATSDARFAGVEA